MPAGKIILPCERAHGVLSHRNARAAPERKRSTRQTLGRAFWKNAGAQKNGQRKTTCAGGRYGPRSGSIEQRITTRLRQDTALSAKAIAGTSAYPGNPLTGKTMKHFRRTAVREPRRSCPADVGRRKKNCPAATLVLSAAGLAA